MVCVGASSANLIRNSVNKCISQRPAALNCRFFAVVFANTSQRNEKIRLNAVGKSVWDY